MATAAGPTRALSWRISVPAPAPTSPGNADAPPAPQTEEQHFLCSADPALIQRDALQQAMASSLLWWASPLAPHQLATMLASSVCLGLYHVGTGAPDNLPTPAMVGFARLITDRVTFAYLTDVYVLPAYQRRGLGAWLIRCLRDMIQGDGSDGLPRWPDLRSLWLVASTPAAARMYLDALEGEVVARYRPTLGVPDSGMVMIEMPGPANGLKNRCKGQGAE